MPYLNIHGANLFHEVYGEQGPWLALTSGGRHRYLEMAPLAQAIAAQGFRVLVHDRRNTGASDIIIAGDDSEEDIWADDLRALLQHYGATQAFLGGSSAGARLAMTVYRRHPSFVSGLLLMRVTGGAFAAGRLPNNYYGQYIKAAHAGGMAAVCDTEPYRERLALNPASRERLMAMDPRDYMAVMGRWLTRGVTHVVALANFLGADFVFRMNFYHCCHDPHTPPHPGCGGLNLRHMWESLANFSLFKRAFKRFEE